jgi:AMP nucleosidase
MAINGDVRIDRNRADRLEAFTDADAAAVRIAELYEDAAGRMRRAFAAFTGGDASGADGVGECRYPYVAVEIGHDDLKAGSRSNAAYGRVQATGLYGTTVTRPDVFGPYYREQIGLLLKTHGKPVWVGRSQVPMPLVLTVDTADAGLSAEDMGALQNAFPFPDLAKIEDGTPNGVHLPRPGEQKPLALFSAQRVDMSLLRLRHYSGTSPRFFQKYVLFTNYQRYVDGFVRWASEALAAPGGGYRELVGPGDTRMAAADGFRLDAAARLPQPQMPAWHLVGANGDDGITIVNIGVGPSNAKTMTDHLAVLRPHCWLMVGHCGGLRSTQRLGDYVLAHAYVRADHVLDADLPTWVPVPPIAEVQTALSEAASRVSGLPDGEVKAILRTGTVFTTDDRDWEFRAADLAVMFNQSRAIAVDMESATIAANGYRFRVPYGTLLCVSDKPLHREPKMPGMANDFYDAQVGRHLMVAIETLEALRAAGPDRLHSRKLRSYDEPAFR